MQGRLYEGSGVAPRVASGSECVAHTPQLRPGAPVFECETSMYTQVCATLRWHPKRVHLSALSGWDDFLAVGRLVCLWLWCLEHRPSGALSANDSFVVDEILRAPGAFRWLVEAGWIDQREDGTSAIHDWSDYGGRYVADREADRVRKSEARRKSGGHPADIRRTSGGSPPLEERRGEKKRREKRETGDAPDASRPPPAPSPHSFILKTATGGQHDIWNLPASTLASFLETYPTIDVATEMRRAGLWCEANPAKRKTSRGMPAFLVSWLNRASTPRTPTAAAGPDWLRGFTKAQLKAARAKIRQCLRCDDGIYYVDHKLEGAEICSCIREQFQ